MYLEDSKDFKLKYQDTYLGYKHENLVKPFLVKDAIGRGRDAYLIGSILTITDKWIPQKIKVCDPNLITKFPNIGVINLSHSPIIINRISKRQWRKTLTPPVIKIYDPFIEERKYFNLPIVQKIDNKSILNSLFNPVYPTKEKAYLEVSQYKKIGCAFNNEWFFASKLRNKNILLYKEDLAIGVMSKDGKTVVIPKAAISLVEQIEDMGLRVEIKV